jgi:hypothetical protein
MPWAAGGTAMRPVNMAKIAAEAEIIRLQAMLKRQGIRAAFGALAAIFALAALVLLNILIWQLLRLYMQPIYATLILLVINLAIAAAFGVLAMRSTPSQTEQDALEVRQRAVRELQGSLALSALLPVAATLFRSKREAAPRRRRLTWRRK